MKLHYSETSPYARKVRCVATLTGHALDLVTSDTWSVPDRLYQANPLGKIPCLELDDGTALYDSRVICEYLAEGTSLTPAGPDRWKIFREAALGDGIMDAAVEKFVEHHRPPAQQDPDWIDRQARNILSAVTALNAAQPEGLTLGAISIACALGYLDIRFPDLIWREGRPAVAAWFDRIAAEAWFAATSPVQQPG